MASSGQMLRADGTILDVAATMEAALARLVVSTTALAQIVANTGGVDNVNIESISLAIQAAAEANRDYNAASKTNLDALVSLQVAARDALLAIRNSSAASAVDLAAIEVINTDIRTAVQIIDNCIGTHDAAAPTQLAIIGGVAEETVPAAVADGDAVRMNFDLYGRHRDAAFNQAQSAGDVTDVAPAQMQVLIETGWAALTAAGDLTPARDVRDHANHTVAYDITIGSLTSMDLIIWGSIDGTLWFPMSSFNVLSTGVLEDAVYFSGVQVTYIRCELEAENGAADGSVVFQLTSGN